MNDIIINIKNMNYKYKVLCENPFIIRIYNLYSEYECNYIINKAKGNLQESTIIDNNQEVVSNYRTSKSAYITKNGEIPQKDIVLSYILKKLQKICGYGINYMEGIKVVNYEKGQEYKSHVDYFKENTKFILDNGDRKYTFFVYLNSLNENEGGTTTFTKLGIVSKPVMGDVLFWINKDDNGNYYDKTEHSGDIVIGNNEKWGMNVWIREFCYN